MIEFSNIHVRTMPWNLEIVVEMHDDFLFGGCNGAAVRMEFKSE
jgi:hypothetical protein